MRTLTPSAVAAWSIRGCPSRGATAAMTLRMQLAKSLGGAASSHPSTSSGTAREAMATGMGRRMNPTGIVMNIVGCEKASLVPRSSGLSMIAADGGDCQETSRGVHSAPAT